MELARLKALIDLVARSRISELEITEAGERIRICRASPLSASPATPHSSQPRHEPAAEPQRPGGAAEAPDETDGHIVVAPMFGIFHRAPSPDSAPFVEIGQIVVPGQKLCIIEAMKTFNTIGSDVAGTVAEIFVESGQEIEAGRPLLRIAP
ncbi:acetyl-CoA carboxylase biotin carboxyl carrier protein [Bosea sp. BE125]|uniref:acetyl-CoA carboxylase biotin carboxyl carrier protein n=1 Tax=Bosea sp. BE125 TaxID=2817909 RepID=UPI00285C11B6|nr:acetyl-CoA carboxylase biotin carboxyl carrier protein [Bosea sp. BE125]MDR6871756.1 acetyl-CoA carboxylase biotin carboxyl carrier protein [Bosea sp. BE125]